MFWVIKLITTGVGEAASDFFGQVFIPLAGVIGIGGVILAFRLQLRATEYRAPVYWFTVMMVAVFGTMVSDGMRMATGISYAVDSVVFGVVTAVVFIRWHRAEGTISIHSITSRRRERFYWSAVLATFALGTSLGDWTAYTLNVGGFFGSALIFAVIIAIPALAWWKLGLSPVVAFWACYVVTRPLGASIADGFSKPHADSGLALGDGLVTVVGVAAFVVLVAYLARAKTDIQSLSSHAPAGLIDDSSSRSKVTA